MNDHAPTDDDADVRRRRPRVVWFRLGVPASSVGRPRWPFTRRLT